MKKFIYIFFYLLISVGVCYIAYTFIAPPKPVAASNSPTKSPPQKVRTPQRFATGTPQTTESNTESIRLKSIQDAAWAAVNRDPEHHNKLKSILVNGIYDGTTSLTVAFSLDDEQFLEIEQLCDATHEMAITEIAKSAILTITNDGALIIERTVSAEMAARMESELLKNIQAVVGTAVWESQDTEDIRKAFRRTFLVISEGKSITTIENIKEVVNSNTGFYDHDIQLKTDGRRLEGHRYLTSIDQYGPILKEKILEAITKKQIKTP